MMMNIRAKFSNRHDAKLAINEARRKLEHLDSKLFDKNNLDEFIQNRYLENLKKDILFAVLNGGIIGVLLGFSLKLIFELGSFQELSHTMGLIGFSFVGFIIGALILTLLTFIKRESIPSLSPKDIKNNQTIAIFDIPSDKLNLVERILKRNRAIKVHIV